MHRTHRVRPARFWKHKRSPESGLEGDQDAGQQLTDGVAHMGYLDWLHDANAPSGNSRIANVRSPVRLN